MGLRNFHLFFIASSLALMALVLRWASAQSAAGTGVAAAAGGLLGLAYLGWFLRKYKTLG